MHERRLRQAAQPQWEALTALLPAQLGLLVGGPPPRGVSQASWARAEVCAWSTSRFDRRPIYIREATNLFVSTQHAATPWAVGGDVVSVSKRELRLVYLYIDIYIAHTFKRVLRVVDTRV